MIVHNPATYFFGEGRVAKNRFVHAKNGRLFLTYLCFQFLPQCAQIDRSAVASRFVTGKFRGNFAFFESLSIRVDEYLVDTISRTHRDARRYRNPSTHDGQCTSARLR